MYNPIVVCGVETLITAHDVKDWIKLDKFSQNFSGVNAIKFKSYYIVLHDIYVHVNVVHYKLCSINIKKISYGFYHVYNSCLSRMYK